MLSCLNLVSICFSTQQWNKIKLARGKKLVMIVMLVLTGLYKYLTNAYLIKSAKITRFINLGLSYMEILDNKFQIRKEIKFL